MFKSISLSWSRRTFFCHSTDWSPVSSPRATSYIRIEEPCSPYGHQRRLECSFRPSRRFQAQFEDSCSSTFLYIGLLNRTQEKLWWALISWDLQKSGATGTSIRDWKKNYWERQRWHDLLYCCLQTRRQPLSLRCLQGCEQKRLPNKMSQLRYTWSTNYRSDVVPSPSWTFYKAARLQTYLFRGFHFEFIARPISIGGYCAVTSVIYACTWNIIDRLIDWLIDLFKQQSLRRDDHASTLKVAFTKAESLINCKTNKIIFFRFIMSNIMATLIRGA